MQSPNNNLSETSRESGSQESSVREMKISPTTKKSPTAFRTISEVASELGVQQHVLRFWETKFSQVKPLKRGGGRRYYRPEDVALLKRIHHLLYTEGYTIKGVQKLLKGQKKQEIISGVTVSAANEADAQATEETAVKSEEATAPETASAQALSTKQRSILTAMVGELKELRSMIRNDDE